MTTIEIKNGQKYLVIRNAMCILPADFDGDTLKALTYFIWNLNEEKKNGELINTKAPDFPLKEWEFLSPFGKFLATLNAGHKSYYEAGIGILRTQKESA